MEYSTDPPITSPTAQLDHHPAAALFPLLEVDSPEFGELVRDIREHGLQQPIVLHEGRILDGRNRHRACQHAGVDPRFVEWDGESPTAYVLSLNLHRRHLTQDQLAAIAVEAKERFEEEAREAQRRAGEHGREGGRGKRKTLRVESHEGFPERDHSAEWARRPLARAAAETGVASNRVRVAEGVKKADPKLFEKVRTGTAPLRGAAKEVEQREGRPGRRAQLRSATPPEPHVTEPEPPATSEPEACSADVAGTAPSIAPPAERIDRPSFEAIENADQDAQRKQFARLCSSLTALPLPTQFVERHDGNLTPDHIEPARAAHQWLSVFLAKLEPEPQPRAAVTWTLDGFLHHLVQANGLMERHGAEIAELLANRISPGPDIAIVREALALLGELDREFGVLEVGAGRAR